MKLAIIGRTQMLYDTAMLLHKKGHQIKAVITSKAALEYSRTEKDFKKLAASMKAPFLITNSLDSREAAKLCKGLDIGISVNWTTVVDDSHIKLFRLGILNAHAADLPRYRGNACLNWAIINGEDKVAACVHFMEGGKLDCGRIAAQDYLPMDGNTVIW